MTYEFQRVCAQPKAMERIYGQLHNNILDVFAECGVQIMTPAYENDPDDRRSAPPGVAQTRARTAPVAAAAAHTRL